MNNWITIQSFVLPQDAYLARAYLESYGLKTFLRDELTVQVDNFISNSIGGVKLQVLESDVEEGIRLLKEGGYIVEKENLSEKVELVNKNKKVKNTCPFCHSKNINIQRQSSILSVILFFVLGALFPIFRTKEYVCHDCDKRWRYK